MPATILLVRHGETAWNRDKIFRGTHDIPLNDNGREQARLAAGALTLCNIDFAYTSPLSRTAETARIVLEPHNIKASVHEGLIDLDFGNWTGWKDEDVAEKWPEEHAVWGSRPDSLRIPGGETLKEVFDRAFGCMEEVAEKHDNKTVALFAHRVVNKLLVIGALGLGLDRFPFIMQGSCCINRFVRTEKGYIVDFINHTVHISNAGADLMKEDF